jgi:hypothetical protein
VLVFYSGGGKIDGMGVMVMVMVLVVINGLFNVLL